MKKTYKKNPADSADKINIFNIKSAKSAGL